jgi:hypothetical protein
MGHSLLRIEDADIYLLTPFKIALFLTALLSHYLLAAPRADGGAPPAVLLPLPARAPSPALDAEGYLAGLDATFFLSCYLSAPLDVEKLEYSLRSYSALHVRWRATYFLIHFAPSLEPPPRARVEAVVAAAFPDPPRTLLWERPTTQAGWRPHIDALTRNGSAPATALLFWMQNHDHPFVDSAPDVLHEGLRALAAERNPFKSLVLSHWPEYVRAAGKGHAPALAGRLLRFESTMTDSYAVFSAPLVRHLFVGMDWGGRSFSRSDFLAASGAVWDASRVHGLFLEMRFDAELMAIYVPLREQCRHFAGYQHAKIPDWLFPPLSLDAPPSRTGPNASGLDDAMLLTRFLPKHESLWTKGNTFVFPREIIVAMLEAHGRSVREGAALAPDAVYGWP